MRKFSISIDISDITLISGMDNPPDAVLIVAKLMEAAAITAPKGKGVNTIVTRILLKNECLSLANTLKSCSEKFGMEFYLRDADNIANSDLVLLIGCRGNVTAGLNCGGCGYDTCMEMIEAFSKREGKDSKYKGPVCAIRLTDLGIAVGSAVKTAQIHNIDNRILFSGGTGAIVAGLLEGCTTAYAIPLSISGKNIFFDRRTE